MLLIHEIIHFRRSCIMQIRIMFTRTCTLETDHNAFFTFHYYLCFKFIVALNTRKNVPYYQYFVLYIGISFYILIGTHANNMFTPKLVLLSIVILRKKSVNSVLDLITFIQSVDIFRS